jgi:hypothetical protein
MRGRHFAFAALIIAVAVAGCVGGHRGPRDEPEMPLPPGVNEAPKGLKFSVKITPSRFKLGEHVKLEATMFNDSEKKFKKDFPNGCQWNFQVARDTRVLGPELVCSMELTQLVLEPGELRMIARDWGGNHYFELDETLTPGTYQVSAGLVENGRVVPMSDPVTIEILSR